MSSKKYTEEFKRQIVQLKKSGRSAVELSREYEVSKQSINTWMRQYTKSGSFKASDNMSESEKELKALRKENLRLRMENDILKQAALILGQKER